MMGDFIVLGGPSKATQIAGGTYQWSCFFIFSRILPSSAALAAEWQPTASAQGSAPMIRARSSANALSTSGRASMGKLGGFGSAHGSKNAATASPFGPALVRPSPSGDGGSGAVSALLGFGWTMSSSGAVRSVIETQFRSSIIRMKARRSSPVQ